MGGRGREREGLERGGGREGWREGERGVKCTCIYLVPRELHSSS